MVGAAGAAGLGELVGEELNGLELGELLPNPEFPKGLLVPLWFCCICCCTFCCAFTAAAPTTVLSFFKS